jgi:hypothetical protein
MTATNAKNGVTSGIFKFSTFEKFEEELSYRFGKLHRDSSEYDGAGQPNSREAPSSSWATQLR